MVKTKVKEYKCTWETVDQSHQPIVYKQTYTRRSLYEEFEDTDLFDDSCADWYRGDDYMYTFNEVLEYLEVEEEIRNDNMTIKRIC
jgi:hypothetical protein